MKKGNIVYSTKRNGKKRAGGMGAAKMAGTEGWQGAMGIEIRY
jgi:hypothetical protein